MVHNTLTRVALAEVIRKRHGLKREESLNTITSILDEIMKALRKDEEVKIPLFGVFFSRHKKERIGRNPKTMKSAVISSRRVAGFRPSRFLKNFVNEGCKKS